MNHNKVTLITDPATRYFNSSMESSSASWILQIRMEKQPNHAGQYPRIITKKYRPLVQNNYPFSMEII